ncbi:MAG: nicotinate (nicotinamide) nucleotide adenylyltransferase [Planctomycetota bacterium]
MTRVREGERLGIFGGSFDPIHVGHLILAEVARERLQLSKVLFVPAAISPLKLDAAPRADAKQRLEMIQLSIGGNEHFAADDRELERAGPSYTVDTLRELQSEFVSGAESKELVFLMGADSLASFDRWKDPHEICRLATMAVLSRGGHQPPSPNELAVFLPQPENAAAHIHPMPQLEISSSDIRNRVGIGQSTRYQLHPAVAAYVQSQGLYRSSSKTSAD